MTALARYLSLVRFSHSVFALPFALQGAWLAAGGVPDGASLALVVLCAVAARTAAMGFNRWLDRDIDAANPRTAGREIPAGLVSPAAALALVLASSAVFVLGAFALNPLCGYLSPAVLAVLLGYSAFKRFSALAHFVLGLALGLAPLGAWLAIRGDLSGDLRPVLLLALGVLTCVIVDSAGLQLPKAYYIEFIPVSVDPLEVLAVGVSALAVCVLATLYPSMTASRLRPVEGLRYE